MNSLNVLAFSSSRVGLSAMLEPAVPVIREFLGDKPIQIAFIPFASADNDYEGYLNKVKAGLSTLPHNIHVVNPENATELVDKSDVIMVGGGNTFKLLHDIYDYKLLELIRQKVEAGTPYIGWSAGSNITGLTIGTTNDMPITEPQSFKALAFFPFQINPHYLNVKPEGFNGETRDQRLKEYLLVNPTRCIIGLPEGTALQLRGGKLELLGSVPAVLFKTEKGRVLKTEIEADTDITYLMDSNIT